LRQAKLGPQEYEWKITATPLSIKVENWRLDMPVIFVYPASIFPTHLDFRLTKSSGTILNSFSWPRRGGGQDVRNNLPSSIAFLTFRL
jgi:hypothetical protein